MAHTGDRYIVTIKRAHLQWGTLRYTGSRGLRYGEGYIHIPADIARRLGLYNSNATTTGLGYNIFNCRSYDGFFQGQIKSAGCSRAGSIYAKQFEGNGNLRAMGSWYAHCNAQVGDHVEVTFISPTDIIIRHF